MQWIAIGLLAAQSVFASQTVTSTTVVDERPARETGFRFFGGAGMGYSSVTSRKDYADAPEGAHYLLGLSADYELPEWVIDLGLGWKYSKESGEDIAGRSIEIRTRSGLASLNPRFRITDRWQMGPSLDVAFGADTSQGPSVGDPNRNLFAGFKTVYEMPLPTNRAWLTRVWFHVSTDLSVSSRKIFMSMAGLQFGLPIKVRDGVIHDQTPQSVAAPMRELRIALDPQAVFFKTNSAELKPQVKEAFREVALYLASNPDGWTALEISGHADRRGKREYNMKLSRRRADSVRSALISHGTEPAKVTSDAFGFSKPLAPGADRVALAKNRRVELIFRDVTEPETIRAKLEPLMLSTLTEAIHEK